MIPNIEQTAMRKVYLRLLPFSVLCMFACYLHRGECRVCGLDDE